MQEKFIHWVISCEVDRAPHLSINDFDETLYAKSYMSQRVQFPCSQASRQICCCCRDLGRILEWCNHWQMILNPNRTKALVVSIDPGQWALPMMTWSCLGVSIRASPNLDILGVKFDSKLTFENMCVVLFSVSLRELVFWSKWNVYSWTPLCYSLQFCICSSNAWVLFSGVRVSCWISPSAFWMPVVFGGQTLSRSKFLLLRHRRHVTGLSIL